MSSANRMLRDRVIAAHIAREHAVRFDFVFSGPPDVVDMEPIPAAAVHAPALDRHRTDIVVIAPDPERSRGRRIDVHVDRTVIDAGIRLCFEAAGVVRKRSRVDRRDRGQARVDLNSFSAHIVS